MKGKVNATLLLLGLVVVVLLAYIVYRPQLQQPYQPQPQPQPTGYTPFPLGTLAIYLKDCANPSSAVTSANVYGRVYSIDTPDSAVASPVTPYLDSDQNDGKLEFSAKKIYTNNAYKVKIWDTASAYYPVLVTVNVPALSPSLGAAAVYTAPDVCLDNVGTFADPMQSDATGAGGGSLQTGVTSSHSTNTVTLDLSDLNGASIETVTVRFTVTLANTEANSKLKNVVLRPIQDTTSGIPTTAFTAATFTHKEGSNFGAPSDILSYISAQAPISLGDWTGGTSGVYYLEVSIDVASLSAGQAFYFRIDDLGNWLATDPIAGQTGAASQYIKIQVVA